MKREVGKEEESPSTLRLNFHRNFTQQGQEMKGALIRRELQVRKCRQESDRLTAEWAVFLMNWQWFPRRGQTNHRLLHTVTHVGNSLIRMSRFISRVWSTTLQHGAFGDT